MKIIAILLLVSGCLLIVGLSLLYFFGFIMSFDAPGSADDPKAWGMRLLFLLPLIVLIAALVLAFLAFQSGNYTRSVGIGSVFVIALLGIFVMMARMQSDGDRYLRELRQQELEDAKHPVQQFIRPTEGGADTIIVFSSRIVAYRVFDKTFNKTIGGPVGKLNKTRDTIRLDGFRGDYLKREEFELFVNESGEKFTTAFQFID